MTLVVGMNKCTLHHQPQTGHGILDDRCFWPAYGGFQPCLLLASAFYMCPWGRMMACTPASTTGEVTSWPDAVSTSALSGCDVAARRVVASSYLSIHPSIHLSISPSIHLCHPSPQQQAGGQQTAATAISESEQQRVSAPGMQSDRYKPSRPATGPAPAGISAAAVSRTIRSAFVRRNRRLPDIRAPISTWASATCDDGRKTKKSLQATVALGRAACEGREIEAEAGRLGTWAARTKCCGCGLAWHRASGQSEACDPPDALRAATRRRAVPALPEVTFLRALEAANPVGTSRDKYFPLKLQRHDGEFWLRGDGHVGTVNSFAAYGNATEIGHLPGTEKDGAVCRRDPGTSHVERQWWSDAEGGAKGRFDGQVEKGRPTAELQQTLHLRPAPSRQ
ncbi:hypothetical protein P280DRAFT_511578 [Massarina eburnea CBS 473.64]|uniref:Uncharacterized protein n=1 Tax=Massarina eburnea CBS 473.64 TaxID=1395130 RepID=A0A6A6RLB8_9PLEO|nr:hypothetical protein P280DRAFT_511578 [Massarina eburnea CBS 473.64]